MKTRLQPIFAAIAGAVIVAACLGQQSMPDLMKPSRYLGVRTIVFSPDGRLLAAGAGDAKKKDEVAIWDAKTLKSRLVQPLDKRLAELAFSPDSKTLAVGTFGDVCLLLDVETGKIKATLAGHGKGARSVAFSPDGTTLAVASNDHDVHLWDWRAAQRVGTLKGHASEVYKVAYSHDGKFLASCGDGTRLWNAANGELLHQWNSRFPIAFDPGDRWLAVGDNEAAVTLHDLHDYKKTWAKFDNVYPYFSLAVHPSAQSFAACSGFDREFRVYSLQLGQASPADEKRVRELMALWEDDRIDVREKASQELAKIGELARPLLRQAMKESPSAEVRVRARNVLTAPPKPAATLAGHEEIAMRCAYSIDGQLLATSGRDGRVLLWDTTTYRIKATLPWPD